MKKLPVNKKVLNSTISVRDIDDIILKINNAYIFSNKANESNFKLSLNWKKIN